MPKSSQKRNASQPVKPYPDFPLYAHVTKRWAKRIRGKIHYFGSWEDGAEAALERYLEQRDALHAGRTPRPKADGLTVRDLVNRHLTWKQRQVDASELTPRTFRDHGTTKVPRYGPRGCAGWEALHWY